MLKLKSVIVKSLIATVLIFCSNVSGQSVTGLLPNRIDLVADNTVVFKQYIDVVSADIFADALVGKRLMIPDLSRTIYVVIDSGGGDYDAAMKMRYVISKVPNVVVYCKYCASAAGYIFATSFKRVASAKSQMMMHELYIPKFTANNVKNDKIVKDLIKSSDDFNEAIYSVIGLSKELYEKRIIGTQWDLYGTELIKWHLADKYVTVHCDRYMSSLIPEVCSP